MTENLGSYHQSIWVCTEISSLCEMKPLTVGTYCSKKTKKQVHITPSMLEEENENWMMHLIWCVHDPCRNKDWTVSHRNQVICSTATSWRNTELQDTRDSRDCALPYLQSNYSLACHIKTYKKWEMQRWEPEKRNLRTYAPNDSNVEAIGR